jgi:hypothetical protein
VEGLAAKALKALEDSEREQRERVERDRNERLERSRKAVSERAAYFGLTINPEHVEREAEGSAAAVAFFPLAEGVRFRIRGTTSARGVGACNLENRVVIDDEELRAKVPAQYRAPAGCTVHNLIELGTAVRVINKARES